MGFSARLGENKNQVANKRAVENGLERKERNKKKKKQLRNRDYRRIVYSFDRIAEKQPRRRCSNKRLANSGSVAERD